MECSPGPGDSAWDVAPWLEALRDVPADASWPRYMTIPHPSAVGSLGTQFVADCERRGRQLRWWQQLTAYRLLEVDGDGRLVWIEHELSTPRRAGKSILLSELALWRIAPEQAMRWGEEQLVVHTGKDLRSCQEVQRLARRWARANGYKVIEANGKESIEERSSGSRWLVLAQNAVYGFGATLPIVDEAWDVPASVVDDGLEPTMTEREQPQLIITSTAHRMATSLFRGRRAAALASIADPVDALMLEWSAPAETPIEDESGWRTASPVWSAERESRIRRAFRRAMVGEVDEDADDDDPVEAFRSQWLNVWPVTVLKSSGSRDELLVDEPVWSGAGELSAPVPQGRLVVAVEDWYGMGMAVAAAGRDPSGRVMVWGRLVGTSGAASGWVSSLLAGRGGCRLLVGASLLGSVRDWPGLGAVEVAAAGSAQTRAGLSALRRMLAAGELVHDGGGELALQVSNALVVGSATGLALSPRSPRCDLVKAAAWAAHGLAILPSPVVFEIL